MSNVKRQMSNVNTIAVVLGRVPELSVCEIKGTLRRAGITTTDLSITAGVALVKAANPPDETWFQTLGGAVKFGRVVAECPAIVQAVVAATHAAFQSRDRLGLQVVATSLSPRQLAGELKAAGVTRRYVLPQHGELLSGAQSKQFRPDRDLELLLLGKGEDVLIIEITAVQDIDEFTKRDRMMPEVDARRGMLPTKLARTMVNIGLGLVPKSEHPVLLDPFCGTGRVLMEARLLGAHVTGSDIDPKAVAASIRNMTWLDETYQLPGQPWDEQIIATDVTKVPTLLGPASVDVIVTEPDLGPPQQRALNPYQTKELFRQLEPTFVALLTAGATVLRPNGGMVVAFPTVGEHSLLDQVVDPFDSKFIPLRPSTPRNPISPLRLEEVNHERSRMIDKLPRFGYHIDDSIRVTRPDQFIARTIAVLRKIKS